MEAIPTIGSILLLLLIILLYSTSCIQPSSRYMQCSVKKWLFPHFPTIPTHKKGGGEQQMTYNEYAIAIAAHSIT